MNTDQNINATSGEKDAELWQLAKKRADFKQHLTVYIVMNIFFWGIYFFSRDNHSNDFSGVGHFPWPVWATFGWGIGILFQYLGAYVYPKKNATDVEYQKLKNKQL